MDLTAVMSALEDSGYDLEIQPSIGNIYRPDFLLVSPDKQRVLVVEVKDNVFTSDVASIDALVDSIESWWEGSGVKPVAEGMIIYSSHAPGSVQEMAVEQGIRIARGVKETREQLSVWWKHY